MIVFAYIQDYTTIDVLVLSLIDKKVVKGLIVDTIQEPLFQDKDILIYKLEEINSVYFDYVIALPDTNISISKLLSHGVDFNQIIPMSIYSDINQLICSINIINESLIITNSLNARYNVPQFNLYERIDDYIRFATLDLIISQIISKKISGNLAELGVFRGDFSAKMNAAFPERKLYLFDTFESFPEQHLRHDINCNPDTPQSSFNTMNDYFKQTSVNVVLEKMIYPEKCVIHKGVFPDSIMGLEDEFALVSLDVDLYIPTLEGLKYFYPRLAFGAFIIIHDYDNRGAPGVRVAVDEYCQKHGLTQIPIPDQYGSVVISKNTKSDFIDVNHNSYNEEGERFTNIVIPSENPQESLKESCAEQYQNGSVVISKNTKSDFIDANHNSYIEEGEEFTNIVIPSENPQESLKESCAEQYQNGSIVISKVTTSDLIQANNNCKNDDEERFINTVLPSEDTQESAKKSYTEQFENYFSKQLEWIEKNAYRLLETEEIDAFRYEFDRFAVSLALLEKYYGNNDLHVLEIGAEDVSTKLIKEYFDKWNLDNYEDDLRLTDWEIGGQEYDLIICMEVLEHLTDQFIGKVGSSEYCFDFNAKFAYTGLRNCLREMRKALKHDGRVFISTPNVSSNINILKILDGQAPMQWVNHIREYTIDELADSFSFTGFDIVEYECIDVMTRKWDFKHLYEMYSMLDKDSLLRGSNYFISLRPSFLGTTSKNELMQLREFTFEEEIPLDKKPFIYYDVHEKKMRELHLECEKTISEMIMKHEESLTESEKAHEHTLAGMQEEYENTISVMKTKLVDTVSQMQTEHEQTVSEMQTKYEQTISQISSDYENTISQVNSDFQNTISDLTSKHDTIISALQAESQRSIQALESEVLELKMYLTSLEALQDQYISTNDDLANRLKIKSDEVDAFLSSTSWRITAPLRAVVRKLRRQ